MKAHFPHRYVLYCFLVPAVQLPDNFTRTFLIVPFILECTPKGTPGFFLQKTDVGSLKSPNSVSAIDLRWKSWQYNWGRASPVFQQQTTLKKNPKKAKITDTCSYWILGKMHFLSTPGTPAPASSVSQFVQTKPSGVPLRKRKGKRRKVVLLICGNNSWEDGYWAIHYDKTKYFSSY